MTSVGTFRFLKDQYYNGEYIPASTVREMFEPWIPFPDVEPMDMVAAMNYYGRGPQLGGCLRTRFVGQGIDRPVTYWRQITANHYQLTGLGATFPPITAHLGRISDKEP